MKWDRRFLRIAYEIAHWSKDRSVGCGAVLVRDRRVLSTGYNGFPSSLDDDDDQLHTRPTKYYATEHAERNAIFNAARYGIAVEGSTMFIFGLFPCSRCARAMEITGVTRVVYGYDVDKNPTGKSPHMDPLDFEIAQKILKNIETIEWARGTKWWENRE